MKLVWDWINEYGSAIGAVAGVVAALVAILALISAALDSKARSQPMVTAEFRPAPDSDSSIEFVVSNLGATPARDVRVGFTPPIALPAEIRGLVSPYLVQRYQRAIPVLNPGQLLSNTWWAGQAGSGAGLTNREPTPDEVRVDVSYKGLGWSRIRDSFDLTIETVTLTTYSVSSTSTKGRMKTIDESLRKIRDHLATIAKKVS
ncbi:hypothetical protein NYQ31_09780 [Curtobacterium flaccumfaciens]|uniref:hypothetical protein n=1 Tax=Curtobacterium flaccumfaciens TaxID=2035 RepID=UPI00217D9EE3|nr:hypothetical protein [Curtobacterium flaccumfaciens]MCS6553988.1 hypothetical protein [Curtobacterium flaccumfaciens]MCS6558687.1 hypothetical protein [Curtobacterium flaccumfaciens]